MQVVSTGSINLKLPEGCEGVLVKNLYLSCDPGSGTRYVINSFNPGSPISGYGVSKVLESGDPKFKEGDLVWGITGWEEYSLITATATQSLLKIHSTHDVPLSYYTGILGTKHESCPNLYSLLDAQGSCNARL
ncbi:2-alkenal reductase (NADP(+)-dependent)-like [Prunus dulcis]|uniref:2-alkenal reductase (NADP(+)-dependent)-like n=1 Tax=Prunus dulcis TaxID=3755 RepID=UPI00148375C4|nr:2-alkenal reductase (NADP(+)-dependent)-like [Prunus dulcis]